MATDAWTSPNHRAFVAWTVQIEHEGHPLVFLLDVVEVPEVCPVSFGHSESLCRRKPWQSHTGATLAREFNLMLLRYGIANKV